MSTPWKGLTSLLWSLALVLAAAPAWAGDQASVLEVKGKQAWLALAAPGQLIPGQTVELVYQAGALPMLLGEWEVLELTGTRLRLAEHRVEVPLMAGMKVVIAPKGATPAPTGVLTVRVVKNEKPTFGRLYLYQQPGDRLVQDLAIPASGILVLNLSPGEYRAVVLHTGLPDGPSAKLGNFSLDAGGAVEKTAEFAEGWLEVEAFRRGKAVPARLKVYRNDGYQLTEGETKPPAPARFALVPGIYAVEAIAPGQEQGALVREIMVRQAGTTKGKITMD